LQHGPHSADIRAALSCDSFINHIIITAR
jgi:hypothetical protein